MPDNPVGNSDFVPTGSDAVNQWIRMFWGPWLQQYMKTITDTETETGQVGLFNIMIDGMNSKNPTQERKIVTGVASYGRQLGRISDALNVLIPLVVSRMEASDLKQDERRALEAFTQMYEEIAKIKGEHVPPNETQLDLLFGEIRDLKGRDDETYRNLVEKLREFAETESGS